MHSASRRARASEHGVLDRNTTDSGDLPPQTVETNRIFVGKARQLSKFGSVAAEGLMCPGQAPGQLIMLSLRLFFLVS